MSGTGMGCWPERARDVLSALPAGALDAAAASLTRGLAATGRLDDTAAWLAPQAVAAQLVRPLLATDDWPGPSTPLPVGDGAVHADLIDDDHDRLATLRSILADTGPLDAETLAAEAQDWRLPVTPYRSLPVPGPGSDPGTSPGGTGTGTGPGSGSGGDARPARRAPTNPTPAASAPAAPLRDGPPWSRPPLVVDLTSLWAGPLATALLAGLGARVVKIDPDCRPDGFREHPRLYAELNGAKEIVDLDLRRSGHRQRFEALADEADLVIDSFSRRVMPNFGYGPDDLRRRNPRLATLSIVAFPAGTREAPWVSYGPGVHAACGLGLRPDRAGVHRFEPAPVAYPDALAGLEAFALAAELLGAVMAGANQPLPHCEVSLAGALAPVVARAVHDHRHEGGGGG